MSKQKKPFIRWVGEALLIFLSVLGAFYFDNYREERNRQRDYVQHLIDFRNDLNINQGKFSFELSEDYQPGSLGKGYMNQQIRQLSLIDSLLGLNPSESEASLIEMINDEAIIGLTEWIFVSPQYEKLNSQFYSYIRNDSVKNLLEMHYRNNIGRHEMKATINAHIADFEDIEDQLNLSDPNDRKNRPILFGNLSRNKLGRIKSNYEALKQYTEFSKQADSLLLIQVEKELADWSN